MKDALLRADDTKFWTEYLVKALGLERVARLSQVEIELIIKVIQMGYTQALEDLASDLKDSFYADKS